MPLVTAENSKLCQTADHDELVKNDFKCTAVPFSVAPDNFYIDVWNKWIPELDINSALHGTVPKARKRYRSLQQPSTKPTARRRSCKLAPGLDMTIRSRIRGWPGNAMDVRPALAVSDLRKRYGPTVALDGLSLTVRPRRGACAPRRERRGQVDSGQVAQRTDRARQRVNRAYSTMPSVSKAPETPTGSASGLHSRKSRSSRILLSRRISS